MKDCKMCEKALHKKKKILIKTKIQFNSKKFSTPLCTFIIDDNRSAVETSCFYVYLSIYTFLQLCPAVSSSVSEK